jgi:hypothetical protein
MKINVAMVILNFLLAVNIAAQTSNLDVDIHVGYLRNKPIMTNTKILPRNSSTFSAAYGYNFGLGLTKKLEKRRIKYGVDVDILYKPYDIKFRDLNDYIYEFRQWQAMIHPHVGYSFAKKADLSVGLYAFTGITEEKVKDAFSKTWSKTQLATKLDYGLSSSLGFNITPKIKIDVIYLWGLRGHLFFEVTDDEGRVIGKVNKVQQSAMLRLSYVMKWE